MANSLVYQRPWLYEKQLEAIFCSERYGIIEASTKTGKTVGCLVWLFEQAASGKRGHNYWWIAPVYQQAKIGFTRLCEYIPRGLYKANRSDQQIDLLNGTHIVFKSADKPDSLFGEDVYAAVVDEASRAKEDAWHAVRSTLTATQGPLRVIGNVKGRKNWFYRLARTAESGAKNMHYARLIAHDAVEAGILTKDEVEDARRVLPDNIFRELYLAEPSDDAGSPFGIDAIRSCIGEMSTAKTEYHGVDLAKHVDWTVDIGLDIDGAVSYFDRYQMPWEETTKRIAASVGSDKAFIDSTGVGDPIVERLIKLCTQAEGFKFTAQSKQQLMEGLAVAIQRGEVRYPEGPISNELEEFEYEYTPAGGVRYTAPSGLHDDCVMALALAVMLRQRHETTPLTSEHFGLGGERETYELPYSPGEF